MVLFTAIPVSLAVVWLASQVGIRPRARRRARAAARRTRRSARAGTTANTGRSAADIFSKGLNLLNDPTGWLFGEPSALYSTSRRVPSSSVASPMSSAQGFGARKGAKELAREQAAQFGDMDGVVTPTPVKAPTAPRD